MNFELRDLEKKIKDLGVLNISNSDRELLVKYFNDAPNLEAASTQAEFLFDMNRIFISTYRKISVANMCKITQDFASKIGTLYLEYMKINYQSQEVNYRTDKFERFKNIVYRTLTIQKQEYKGNDKNKEAIREALYEAMLDAEAADKLLSNCLKRSVNFTNQTSPLILRGLINILKTEYKFTNEELIGISSRAATFFSGSNGANIRSLEKVLEEFKEFINKGLNNKKAKGLLERSFKDILLNSSTIATFDSDAIKDTIRFLQGEEATKIITFNKDLSGLKGDFNNVQLAKIYSKSITALSINLSKIANFSYNIKQAYERTFNEEFSLDGIINGNNFNELSLLSYHDFNSSGKVKEILGMFSKFLSAKDMKNLLKNHIGFLCCSEDQIKKGLREAVLASEDNAGIKKHILEKVKNCFDIFNNNLEYNHLERKEYLQSNRFGKVDFKNLNTEDIENILKDLGASENEYKEFIKKWDKEEKFYREVEIEDNLSKVIEQTDELNGMLNEFYSDTKSKLEAISIYKNLFEDINAKYLKIVQEGKIPQKLSELQEKASSSLEFVADRINNDLDVVISEYDKAAEELKRQLDEVNTGINDYYRLDEDDKIDQEYIKENEINEEELQVHEQNLEDLKKSKNVISNNLKILKKDKRKIKEILNFSVRKVLGVNHKGIKKEVFERLYADLITSFYNQGLLPKEYLQVDLTNMPLTYDEYKVKTFSDAEIEVLDNLKNSLLLQKQQTDHIKEQVIELLEFFNPEISEIDDLNVAYEQLKDNVEEYERIIKSARGVLEQHKKTRETLDKIDVGTLEDEYNVMLEKLEKITGEIEKIKAKKIKL